MYFIFSRFFRKIRVAYTIQLSFIIVKRGVESHIFVEFLKHICKQKCRYPSVGEKKLKELNDPTVSSVVNNFHTFITELVHILRYSYCEPSIRRRDNCLLEIVVLQRPKGT